MANKIDIAKSDVDKKIEYIRKWTNAEIIMTSTKTRSGLSELVDKLKEILA